jgi:hypothetical protein
VGLSQEAAAAAREANVAMVPGFAFYGAVADLLATVVASELQDVEEIEIAYRVTGWRPPAASFRSRIDGLTRPWYFHDHGRLLPAERWPATRWFEFAAPLGRQRMSAYPVPDVVVTSWHLPAARIRSWMNVETLAPKILGPFLPWIVTSARRLVRSPARRLVEAVLKVIWGSSETKATDETTFVVAVRARGKNGERRAEIAGRGIYDISARMVVDAAIQLMEPGRSLVGVRAPAEVFEPRAYLDRLRAYGVTYVIDPSRRSNDAALTPPRALPAAPPCERRPQTCSPRAAPAESRRAT